MWSGTALTAGGGHNNSDTSQHTAKLPNYQVGCCDRAPLTPNLQINSVSLFAFPPP